MVPILFKVRQGSIFYPIRHWKTRGVKIKFKNKNKKLKLKLKKNFFCSISYEL